MDESKCFIKMLSANEGDCILIKFEYENQTFNLLIDTGPGRCWNVSLKCCLDMLRENKERINVLLITHIDSDHIGGALKLFDDVKYAELVDEVWFNGFKQVITDEIRSDDIIQKKYRKLQTLYYYSDDVAEGGISASQARALSELLEEKSIPVNLPAYGKAITDTTNSIRLSDEFFIDFILPKQSKLERLKEMFQIEMFKIGGSSELVLYSDGERAFEFTALNEYCESEQIEPISETLYNLSNIEQWASATVSEDTSKTNASSIVICIRFYGRKLLFLGDAVSNDIIEALQKWAEIKKENLFFDLIKLPHHGAANNNLEMLDYIDGVHFLISTDGKRFNHPSKETLAKIIIRQPICERRLIFNYENKMYDLYLDQDMQKKYNYKLFLNTDVLDI